MCNNSKQLYGAANAALAVDQGPIFNPKNITESSLEARLSFSKVMNKLEDKQARVNIEKYSRKDGFLDQTKERIQLGRTPEALLPKHVYGKIDAKMTQWSKYYQRSLGQKIQAVEKKYAKAAQKLKGDDLKALEIRKQKELNPLQKQAEKSYKELISKQIKTAKNQTQAVYDKYGDNPKRLDVELKKMGLTREDAYYAHNYMSYIENGGPFFRFNAGSDSKVGNVFIDMVSTITGKKISFDPKQVIYNTSEFLQKAPAVAGFSNTVKGIKAAQDAAHKSGLTVFDRLPELEKQGIYNNDSNMLRLSNQMDTTVKSQNALDNLSYFVGKQMGDVDKAMKEIAFRPKPWNDTSLYQDPRMKSMFGFMSFQFRHMQQYGGWLRDLTMNKDVPKARIEQSAKALATYSLMTGLLFGDRAAIPAPIYQLIKAAFPDAEKDLKEMQADIPILNTGLVGEASKLVGLDVDMTKYVQPLGGVAIGLGTDIAQGAQDAATRTIPKTIKEVSQGEYGKGAAVLINGLVQYSQLYSKGASAGVQKTVDGVIKAYLEDEFTVEGVTENVAKKYLGREAVSSK